MTLPPPKPAQKILAPDECPFRRQEIRREVCPSCRGAVQVKVFECSLHGECTLKKKVPGVHVCDIREPEVIPNTGVVVLNSNRHGYGDACVMAWVSEGSKQASRKLVHHATGGKKLFLELLGQTVVDRQNGMVDTFRAYSEELRLGGDPPRICQRGAYLGIKTPPKRPPHTLTPGEIEAASRGFGGNAVLLFPNTDYGSREWPAFYWLDLAAGMRKAGFDVHFCGGKADGRYAAFPGYWGRTWREIAAAMLVARLVIGNDSGPAHLAGTLDVPTMAILGPTTPSVFVQYGSVWCATPDKAEISCAGCYFGAPFSRVCEVGCAALCHVRPARVIDEALQMIEQSKAVFP